MAKSNANNGESANKSEAVREELTRNPKAGTKEVIAALAERGVKVAPTLVYYIRSKQSHARRKIKREQIAETSRNTHAANPVEVVLRVKDLAREVGGIKNLKMLVDLLAE
jgi:hypothetical protein